MDQEQKAPPVEYTTIPAYEYMSNAKVKIGTPITITLPAAVLETIRDMIYYVAGDAKVSGGVDLDKVRGDIDGEADFDKLGDIFDAQYLTACRDYKGDEEPAKKEGPAKYYILIDPTLIQEPKGYATNRVLVNIGNKVLFNQYNDAKEFAQNKIQSGSGTPQLVAEISFVSKSEFSVVPVHTEPLDAASFEKFLTLVRKKEEAGYYSG